MKLSGARLLWISGLVLAASTAVFSRVSDSLNSSAAQPQLAALASFYKSSDPYVLTATFSTAPGFAAPVELTGETARSPGKTDFSAYLHLHVTRADNLAERDGID